MTEWHSRIMPQHLIGMFLVQIPNALGQALGLNLIKKLPRVSEGK